MKLAQKLLTTISFNLELSDQVIALEVLRDIRDYYNSEVVADLMNKSCTEIVEHELGKELSNGKA